MATFIDEDENQVQEDEQFDNIEDQAKQEEASEQEKPSAEEDENDIPEKYRGKSVKDIVRMHQEAERAMGKQGSEVGELRKLVDDYIRAQTVTPKVEEDVDFFEDPKKAIAAAIDKHPKVRQAEELAAHMRRTSALNTLKTEHPDYSDIVNDPAFGEWILQSKVRKELYSRADQQYDYDAANELISTWKERKNVVKQAADVEKLSRKQAIKTASTGSTKGTGEASSRKVYRRTDIIELMRRDPDRYQALSDEIMQAYAEGRVK